MTSYRFHFILSLLLITGCGQKPASDKASGATGNTIKVGTFAALTGGNAVQGQVMTDGVRLAIEEVNAAGGVLGRQIELLSEDTQTKSSDAATVAAKLITNDNVVALIGEHASSRSLAAAPIAQQSKIPMLSPASTNEKVTEIGDYIFRVCFVDAFQGEVMAKFAANNLKAKKVVILKDVKSDYSVGLAAAFTKTFTAQGGVVLAEQAYGSGDKDYKAQLTAVRSLAPDVIFVPGYYAEVALIARQARELGIAVPLIGCDAWDSSALVEVAGAAVDGCYYSNHISYSDTAQRVQTFVAAYRKRFNMAPEVNSALGYDAGKIMAEAIRASGTAKPEDIRAALAATKNFPGITGSITIDERRNAQKPAVVLRIEKGVLVPVASIMP